ncbi:MAG: hypothetical protein F4X11_06890 [Acidobacteria bacterium]|nr:hypothetical protein [Acidobacteriota bacterium]
MRDTQRSFWAVPVCLAVLASLSAAPASAQGSAWIAEPETGSVNFSFVRQFTDKYFRSENSLPVDRTLPAALSQNTFWFGFNYAFTDAVAIDVQTGAAKSLFPGPPAGTPTTSESFSGLVDTNVALTWRVVDELVSDAPSVAFRVAAIAAGGYETGHINALGDGGNGFEGSIIVGKFAERVGASAEVGYRYRTDDIPADMFFNGSLLVPAGSRVIVGADYRMVNAMSGLDIGVPPFSPPRFPEVQEDIHLVGGRLIINATDVVSVSGIFGKVVKGRNTASSNVFGLSLGFAFDTF